MLLLNLGIVNNPKSIINADKNLPWFKNQIKQQGLAILVYAIAAAVAFYSPTIALAITFLMWVFWAIVTKDNEDEA